MTQRPCSPERRLLFDKAKMKSDEVDSDNAFQIPNHKHPPAPVS
jgi:hypothetical protein